MKNPYINNEQNQIDANINKAFSGIMPENFNTAGFIKGALLGAGITYILTNEKAQQAIFKAIVKAGSMLEAGVEELKERFEDAKAEIDANK